MMNEFVKEQGLPSKGDPRKKKQKPFVSLIVPAYNEEKIIRESLARLCQYMNSLEDQYSWELIVINDGSTDNTGNLAEDFVKDKDNAFVLHHMFNFRLGQALKFAFSRSRGDYVVVLDADLSYSPEHIGRMLEKIKETRAKIVIASPFMKGGKLSNIPWLRKLFSIWANRFLCAFATRDYFSDRLTNITGMVRAYDGEFLRRMNLWAMDVDINSEIIYKAKILRARIVEVPANLSWTPTGAGERGTAKRRKSSIRIRRAIVQSLLSGFILRPFMFFILPGFVLFILALYPLAWAMIHTVTFYQKISNPQLAFDYRLSEAISAAYRISPHSFIIGGIVLLIAIQLISLGFLAFQKKRYFEELFYLGSIIHTNVRPGENTPTSKEFTS